MFRTPQFFALLTWRCASCHNSVHFFHIATSKSGPRLVCFVHCDFDMCFAPQRRALFRHRNSKSLPKLRCFVHFDLETCFAPQRRALFRHRATTTLRSHKSLRKHSVSRLFYLFAHLHLPSSDSFSSLIFSLLLFSFLTLLTSAFPSAHIVGSLTSKLPWIKININIISHIV